MKGQKPHIRMANVRNRIGRKEEIYPLKRNGSEGSARYVKVSEFDQTLGKVGIPHAVIGQHAGSWPEVERQPALTYVGHSFLNVL